MLERLSIALAQVQAGNTSGNLLNKIKQTIYYLYLAKEYTKKVYNNIMNLIKVQYKMNTLFMNSENIKTSDIHSLLLNLTDKIWLKRSVKYVDLSNLSMYHAWKKIKKDHIRTINLKYQLEHVMKNLNYLMHHILYQIFKITFD